MRIRCGTPCCATPSFPPCCRPASGRTWFRPEARGVLNIRLLPGNLVTPLLAKLQTLVNDPEIRFEVEPNAGETAPSSSTTSDLYNTISRVAKQQFPGAAVVPDMSTSATDSIPLRLRSVQAYGMLPFPITEEDRAPNARR